MGILGFLWGLCGRGVPPAVKIVTISSLKSANLVHFFNYYWGLTPQQQPGSYQGGEMMMMKSVFWWRKPEYPEKTTDLYGK